MEVIKKYTNRKLYSTTLSKYVKLEYVLDLVKTNQKFSVIKNDTKTDITRETMMQSLALVELSQNSIAAIIRGQ